jgi:transposase
MMRVQRSVGAPSLPPGMYFRMHMIGYFEVIDSERGIDWRCSVSYSLRDFLQLASRDKVTLPPSFIQR